MKKMRKIFSCLLMVFAAALFMCCAQPDDSTKDNGSGSGNQNENSNDSNAIGLPTDTRLVASYIYTLSAMKNGDFQYREILFYENKSFYVIKKSQSTKIEGDNTYKLCENYISFAGNYKGNLFTDETIELELTKMGEFSPSCYAPGTLNITTSDLTYKTINEKGTCTIYTGNTPSVYISSFSTYFEINGSYESPAKIINLSINQKENENNTVDLIISWNDFTSSNIYKSVTLYYNTENDEEGAEILEQDLETYYNKTATLNNISKSDTYYFWLKTVAINGDKNTNGKVSYKYSSIKTPEISYISKLDGYPKIVFEKINGIDNYRLYRSTSSDPETKQLIKECVITDYYSSYIIDTLLYNEGTYYYWITAIDSTGEESNISNCKSFEYIIQALTGPNFTADLSGEIFGIRRINISITKKLNINHYNIYTSTENNPETAILLDNIYTDLSNPLYTYYPTTSGTHYFWITSVSGSDESELGEAKSVDYELPKAFLQSSTSNSDSVTLSWNNPLRSSFNIDYYVTDYEVYYNTENNIATAKKDAIVHLTDTTNYYLEYTFLNLEKGIRYYFWIKPITNNNYVTFDYSDPFSATCSTIKAPSCTCSLTADNTVALKLSTTCNEAKHTFNIYRNNVDDFIGATCINSKTTADVTYTYIDDSLTTSDTYYYWVTDKHGTEESNYTHSYRIDFTAQTVLPPKNITVASKNGIITLTWDAPVIGNPVKYNIYLSTSRNYDYKKVKTVTDTFATVSAEDNPTNDYYLYQRGTKYIKISSVTADETESVLTDFVTCEYTEENFVAPGYITGEVNPNNPEEFILSWPAVKNARFYKLYSYNSSSYSVISERDWTQVETSGTITTPSITLKKADYSSGVWVFTVKAFDSSNTASPFCPNYYYLTPSYPYTKNVENNNGIYTISWSASKYGTAAAYNVYVGKADRNGSITNPELVGTVTANQGRYLSINPAEITDKDSLLFSSGNLSFTVTSVSAVGYESLKYYTSFTYETIPTINELEYSLDDSKSVISLKWDEPAYGSPTEYDIYVRGYLTGFAYLKTVNTTSTTLSSNDATEDNDILHTDTNKIIRVYVIAKNAKGQTSLIPETKTEINGYEAHPAPQARLSLNEEGKLVISWNPVGNASCYEIFYCFDNFKHEADNYKGSGFSWYEDNQKRELTNTSFVLMDNIFYSKSNKYCSFAIAAKDKNSRINSINKNPTPSVPVSLILANDISNEEMEYNKLLTDYVKIDRVSECKSYLYKVKAGQKYALRWSDSSGEYTSIDVDCYYLDDMFDSKFLVNNINNGYTTPAEFTATKDGYVVIEAASYTSSSAPTFGSYLIGIYPID